MPIDPSFLGLPLDSLADVALAVAKARGATHADFRLERLRSQTIVARDRELETSVESEAVGFSVRVVHKGAWGFAAGIDLAPDAVASVAGRAIEVAESLARLNTESVILARRARLPGHVCVALRHRSVRRCRRRKDQFFARPERPRAGVKADRPRHLARDSRARAEVSGVARGLAHHAAARASQRRYHGGAYRQSRGRLRNDGVGSAPGRPRDGSISRTCYDFGKDADEIPGFLEQKMGSPSITPGRYDVVIDPTNLWLTIHESIGHSTELDRVLGYEANYAGTSFATLDKLNTLQFGAADDARHRRSAGRAWTRDRRIRR